MAYDEELRCAEIRNNKRNVEARKEWYGPEDLAKAFTLPDDLEEKLADFWYSLKAANFSWHSVKDYYNTARRCTKALMDAGMNIVTLPKTIDNDIWGTDTTFGFQSAVDVATDTIDRIGFENVQAQLLADDILARKEEIIGARLHLKGGATC